MAVARLEFVHPVLPTQDVRTAIRYYVDRLGFVLAFTDAEADPRYAGVRRDSVELHLQWHDAEEWAAVERPMLRLVVSDVDALFAEFQDRDVFHAATTLRNTPWETREFAFYDVDGNGLTFYRDVNQTLPVG